nr:hypothetical protein CFP56_19264 [Quercus suber]
MPCSPGSAPRHEDKHTTSCDFVFEDDFKVVCAYSQSEGIQPSNFSDPCRLESMPAASTISATENTLEDQRTFEPPSCPQSSSPHSGCIPKNRPCQTSVPVTLSCSTLPSSVL